MAINPKYLNPGEVVLVSTRTHPKELFKPLAAIVVALAAVVAVVVLLPEGQVWDYLGWGAWAVGAGFLIWFVARPLMKWLTTTYTFTDRRFITRTGLIATEGTSIPLSRIVSVDFEIGLIDRIFGCGTLLLGDASLGEPSKLHDIPDVERINLAISEKLHEVHTGQANPFGNGAGNQFDQRNQPRGTDGA